MSNSALLVSHANSWQQAPATPDRPGWYVTRKEKSVELNWRAWGSGTWWEWHGNHWQEMLGQGGVSLRFDFLKSSRQSLTLAVSRLPSLS